MKLTDAEKTMLAYPSFSILERIELGETTAESLTRLMPRPFSILERIELGETSSR